MVQQPAGGTEHRHVRRGELLAYGDGFGAGQWEGYPSGEAPSGFSPTDPARLVKDPSANAAASGNAAAIDGDRLLRCQKYHHVSSVFGIDHAAFLAITPIA